MEIAEAELMASAQVIFDPVAKTVMIIQFDKMIAVPGRFETYKDARLACVRVMMTKYANAYKNE